MHTYNPKIWEVQQEDQTVRVILSHTVESEASLGYKNSLKIVNHLGGALSNPSIQKEAFGRKGQADLYEFEASLAYRVTV